MKKIQEALQFIERHICENIGVKRIAQNAFLSPRHFHRLFTQYTGTSPRKYVEQKKMEKALQVLQQPEIQISDLAFTLGYRNYETFSTRFRLYYNIAPGDLKNILDTIRHQRNEIGMKLNFRLISSDYTNISEKLDQLKKTIGNDEIETLVAIKGIQAGIRMSGKSKYSLTKYFTK